MAFFVEVAQNEFMCKTVPDPPEDENLLPRERSQAPQAQLQPVALRKLLSSMLMLVAVAAAVFVGPRELSAQRRSAFATIGVVNFRDSPVIVAPIGGGLVFDVLDSWASVGGRGDLLFSGGYFSGRGGPIAQINFIRDRAFRPFAIAGFAWGEEAGAMFGAGIEAWSQGRAFGRASRSIDGGSEATNLPYLSESSGTELSRQDSRMGRTPSIQ